MERYYEELDKRFEDRELILESILYEADLYATFGPAMEKTDGQANNSTVVSVGDGSTKNVTSSGGGTSKPNSTAAQNINNAGQLIENNNDAAKTEANKDNKQSLNEASSKAKQELSNTVKEVVDAVNEFIQKYLTEFRTNMSTMLNENANTVEELKKLTQGKKPNYNITVKDYLYNNDTITKTSNALSKAFDEYIPVAKEIQSISRSVSESLKDGDDQKKDADVNKLITLVKGSGNTEHINLNTATNESEAGTMKLIRPHVSVARELGFKGENLSLSDLKKRIHAQYKGLREGQTEAQNINLQNNQQVVQNAERFIMDYKTYLRTINTSTDKLRNNADIYKEICETAKNLPLVDDKVKGAFTNLMNIMASDLNEFVNISEFLITILKERAIGSEILIRKVYGVNPIPAKDRANQTNKG